MEDLGVIASFFKDRKVLVTGHTGFKGSWLSYMLCLMGARVTGLALAPQSTPNLFSALKLEEKLVSKLVDIRSLPDVKAVFDEAQPEFVFHLAAQPLVLDSYKDPVYTYETNVMGSVNVCECVRTTTSVRSFVNVTTDKVYQNNEWVFAYRENDVLNGYDPYSNSKSCSELVTSSYINSFFKATNLPVSTCRAGNVIGGGDFSENRIIPDCIKAALGKQSIGIRNPNSVRPYQHVLEAVSFYLDLARRQYGEADLADCYNIGPEVDDCLASGTLATLFCEAWGEGANWTSVNLNGPHEANFLKLDTTKAKSRLRWAPVWDVRQAVEHSVAWTKCFYAGEDIEEYTRNEIRVFMKGYEHVARISG